MSEALRHQGETETPKVEVESNKNLERLKELGKKEAEKTPEDIAEIQKSAEQQAISAKEVAPVENEQPPAHSSFGIQQELKDTAYRRSMQRIRSKLSTPERVFSKVIHQPAVDAVSNIGAKTIARPSGIIGAGVVTFIGSTVLLIMSKHYGFTYNYTVFFVLFGVGFGAGLIIEVSNRLLHRNRS